MPVIVAYGDSNTWGYDPAAGARFPAGVRWTGVMSAALGADFRVIEEGLNGRTSVFDDPIEPYRNGLDYLPPCLLSHAPLDLIDGAARVYDPIVRGEQGEDLYDCFLKDYAKSAW